MHHDHLRFGHLFDRVLRSFFPEAAVFESAVGHQVGPPLGACHEFGMRRRPPFTLRNSSRPRAIAIQLRIDRFEHSIDVDVVEKCGDLLQFGFGVFEDLVVVDFE